MRSYNVATFIEYDNDNVLMSLVFGIIKVFYPQFNSHWYGPHHNISVVYVLNTFIGFSVDKSTAHSSCLFNPISTVYLYPVKYSWVRVVINRLLFLSSTVGFSPGLPCQSTVILWCFVKPYHVYPHAVFVNPYKVHISLHYAVLLQSWLTIEQRSHQ